MAFSESHRRYSRIKGGIRGFISKRRLAMEEASEINYFVKRLAAGMEYHKSARSRNRIRSTQ